MSNYKTIDDDLLLILITEPFVLVYERCDTPEMIAFIFDEMDKAKYAEVELIGNYYKLMQGDKFDKIIKHYKKETLKVLRNGH